MKLLPLLLTSLLVTSSYGQVVGAIETFSFEENANSWNLYDYFTDEVDAPLWTLPDSTDPEIYAKFSGDYGTSLFASEISSDQYFVGDYVAAGVAGIFCNVYAENVDNFDVLEFYLVHDDVFYVSNYFVLDFDGWSTLEIYFDESDWYVYNEDTEDYDLTTLTDTILSDVVEIGINFYPLLGASSDGEIVGIDNFVLLADTTPTEPEVGIDGASGSLSFQTVPGIEYTIEQSSTLESDNWVTAGAGPFESTGPYTYDFTAPERLFFRIKQEALYFDIPQVDPL